MPNADRLSGLDTSFLHLENGGAHMHVAGVLIFRGEPPHYDDLVAMIESRLHLVPRYRQRLAFVPLDQGRPVWVDDPHFNIAYHVRHAALPTPGTDHELRVLAGRLFAQPLDRSKPLWELILVEGLDDDRFALISKTHHALVDGVSGVDITSVLFDTQPDPAPVAPPDRPWIPRPVPSSTHLLGDALVERATQPAEILRGVRAAARRPQRAVKAATRGVTGVSQTLWAGLADTAPASPFNVPIGPHRRYTWVDAPLDGIKDTKNALGGTVNDVVLAAVSLGLGRFLKGRGEDITDKELRAMVPVSVRAEVERGALGNRVAAMWAPLPVGVEDPAESLAVVSAAMSHLKDSGQAVGAQVLTELTDFAPPTIMSQAARLQARQRLFNLVVTNVPGPQIPLYLLGRQMLRFYPVVPLAKGQALGIAIMSYDGSLYFGLLGDWDALPDLDTLGDDVAWGLRALRTAAAEATANGTARPPKPRRRVTPAIVRA
jgi:WS/DGAT/MGAT family acyltransferase